MKIIGRIWSGCISMNMMIKMKSRGENTNIIHIKEERNILHAFEN
jgi:hypothetical protein